MSFVAVDGGTRRVPRRRAGSRRGRSSSSTSPAGTASVLQRSTTLAPDPADVAVSRARRVPDDRRPDRVRHLLPRRRAGRSRGPDGELPPLIVTSHGGPTAEASTAFAVRHPAVHEPRLRRPRRRLRRLDRLRHATTASASRASGASSTSTTASPARAGSPSRGSSTASGSRSAAAAPAATRRSCAVTFRDAFSAGHELLRDRRPRDVRQGDPQVRVALPRAAHRAVSGARRTSTTTARR